MAANVEQFCRDTDIHGAKFLFDNTSGKIRKFCWLLLIIGSSSFLVYLFSVRISSYLERQVTTKVSVSTGTVPIPSLRICGELFMTLDATKLTASDIVNAYYLEDGKLELNESLVFKTMNGRRFFTEGAISMFQKLLSTELKDSEALPPAEYKEWIHVETETLWGNSINWRVLLKALVKHGSKHPLQDKKDYNIMDVVRRALYDYKLGITCEVLIINEDGVIEEEDCSQNWTTVTTELGSCSVLQVDGAVLGIRSLNIRRESESLVIPNARYRRLYVVLDSPQQGVETALYRREIPAVLPWNYCGIRVYRRSEIRRLSEPFSRCVEDDMLTTSSCVAKCKADNWQKRFGCIEHFMTTDNNYTVCRRRQKNIVELWLEMEVLHQSCVLKCPKPCREDMYKIVIKDEATFQSKPTNNNTVFIVSVSSDSSTETVRMEELELYPVSSLLAELGGTMGLFIGISVLSVFHVLEFLLSLITSCCRGTDQQTSQVGDVRKTTDVTTLEERLLELQAAVDDMKVMLLRTQTI